MRAHCAVLVSALCTGCNWTGFGFHAEGGELPRLREALALQAGAVVADVGAGKGELSFALAKEVRQVFATEIDPDRLRRLRDAKPANVTVVEAQAGESGLPRTAAMRSCCAACITT